MNNEMTNFFILKFFNINTRPRKGTSTIQVIQKKIYVGWIKVNMDIRGCPGYVICGGTSRGSQGEYISSHISYRYP